VLTAGLCLGGKEGDMKATHCDECKHFNDEDVPGARVCEKNHKPRWYAPKNDNPHDLDYGYKRKCGDYEGKRKCQQ
jgi:hypothetical protein